MDYYRPETYRAQDSIGYLMYRATHAVRGRIEAKLAVFELSFHQWLSLLWLRDGVADTASDIAKCTNIDPGALARMLENLETRGWIARERSKLDRRVVALSLTEAGSAGLVMSMPTVLEELNLALGSFSHDEVDQLTFLLRKLLAHQQTLATQSLGTPS